MALSNRKAFHRARMGKPDATKKAIVDGLRALGHFVVVITASDKAGVPDLLVRHRQLHREPGENFTFLELKAADGEESEAQAEWRAAAQARGVRVRLARNLDEALAAVNA